MHVLYLIDSLSMGGAETIVVNTLNCLSTKYTFVKFSLCTTVEADGPLAKKLNATIAYKHINCGELNFFRGSLVVRAFIKKHKVTHVHSHLYHSIMVGRLAAIFDTNVIETYHNLEYHPDSVYYSKWRVDLDKLTFRKKTISIYVSEEVKQSIADFRPLTHSNIVLNNFAGIEFKYNYKLKSEPSLKLVAIGNLKTDKNFLFALKTFGQLIDADISLDIYGEGFLKPELEKYIASNNLKVRLMGSVAITMDIFVNYDAFLMTSLNEGMPISLLEALNFGMPCILPDHLSVMKQVAQNAGLYFSIKDVNSLKNLLLNLLNDKETLQAMSSESKKQTGLFSIDAHVSSLADIYKLDCLPEKKCIIILIDNLKRGGAETMLINLLPDLNQIYNVVLVTLNNDTDFTDSEGKTYAMYSLEFNSFLNLPRSVSRLKKIIQKHSPVLVHTQLYLSTIIGRMSVPHQIPFVFSIHSLLSKDAFEGSKMSLYLERLSYDQRQTIISVSEIVFKDYAANIKVRGPNFILNNFVHNKFFEHKYDFNQKMLSTINLVAVGNLKQVKNYIFLLNVIKELKDNISIALDIVGEGSLNDELQEFIDMHQLPVKLLGSRSDVDVLLPNYDGFVMCSLHEGFGNAPLEAMAVGLPLILNDLDAMKEMSRGNAVFYKSTDVDSLKTILLNFGNKKVELLKLSEQGKIIAKKFYSQNSYFLQLKNIYDALITNNNQS